MRISPPFSINTLTEYEARSFQNFRVGESYSVPARTPHFIVNQGRRVAGIVIGKNSRPETRVYDYDVKLSNTAREGVGFNDKESWTRKGCYFY